MQDTEKQKKCKHLNVVATETYGVSGHWDEETKQYLLKQGDGGIDDNLECEDCGKRLVDVQVEFV